MNAKGGYFILYKVQYDTLGAQGAMDVPAGPLHTAQPLVAAGADGPRKDGYTFTCWNTQENLRG